MTELFYGAKGKGNYQRFQKRAVTWTAVLGVLVLLAVIDGLFLKPWIREWQGQHYRFEFMMINEWILLPIGCIAAGKLVPAVVSLWRDVRPGEKTRRWLRIAGFVLLIPAFCFAVDAIVWGIIFLKTRNMTDISISVNIPVIDKATGFFRSDPTGFRLRLACTYLPFLSGLCLYPSFIAPGPADETGKTE